MARGHKARRESVARERSRQDGIQVSAATELVILDTIVRDNGGFGVSVVNDATVVADRLRSEHNAGSGFGIVSATNEASATISDSVFAHNQGNGVVADAAGFATTRIQVDRSVMANNLGPGFFATSAHTGSVVDATLVRNTVNRNHDDGIFLSGTSPDGLLFTSLAENAVQASQGYGIHIISSGASLRANTSTNNSLQGLACEGSSAAYSIGNNYFAGVVQPTGCYVLQSGN